ncbi:hypothetical protein B0H14DRAFT_3521933 [Mycena olivaceomarginata]|nr:hypothetical protein B0H14DRAFT_3521933 [Mycena olivaceomarginata]
MPRADSFKFKGQPIGIQRGVYSSESIGRPVNSNDLRNHRIPATSGIAVYQELDEQYDGFRNRATGEHVVHFHKPRKRIAKENTAATSVTSASPTASPAASTSNLKSTGSVDTAGDVTPRAPMLVLDNTQPDGEAAGGLNNYDDDLRLVCVSFIELHTGLPMLLQSPPRPPTKRTRAESDDDDATDPEPKRPRVKSNSSTGSSTAKRNAEAGSQSSPSMDTNFSCAGRASAFVRMSATFSFPGTDEIAISPSCTRSRMKCQRVSMCFDSPCPFVVSVRLIDPRLSLQQKMKVLTTTPRRI